MVPSPVLVVVTMIVACCYVTAHNIISVVISARSRGGTVYKIFTTFQQNYFDAQNYCDSEDMDLASITSAEEQRILEAAIKKTGLPDMVVWTSGNDLEQTGRFVWGSNGQPFTYTNWMDGQPNHSKLDSGEVEHCVRLEEDNNFQWNDWFCSDEGYVACQVKRPILN